MLAVGELERGAFSTADAVASSCSAPDATGTSTAGTRAESALPVQEPHARETLPTQRLNVITASSDRNQLPQPASEMCLA